MYSIGSHTNLTWNNQEIIDNREPGISIQEFYEEQFQGESVKTINIICHLFWKKSVIPVFEI